MVSSSRKCPSFLPPEKLLQFNVKPNSGQTCGMLRALLQRSIFPPGWSRRRLLVVSCQNLTWKNEFAYLRKDPNFQVTS